MDECRIFITRRRPLKDRANFMGGSYAILAGMPLLGRFSQGDGADISNNTRDQTKECIGNEPEPEV